jgi:hypothetical protein
MKDAIRRIGRCVYCGHQGEMKEHGGGDLVCADDAACLDRGYKGSRA